MYLSVGLKVIVKHIDTDGKVPSVVGIGAVPALWTKLAPFNHNGMKVDEREENAFEFILTRAHLQCVLIQ